MAIHYDANIERFRDEDGHFVSYDRGIRSSIAREEYNAAQEEREEAEDLFEELEPAESEFDHADIDLSDMDFDELWDWYQDDDHDEDVEEGKSP